MKTIFLLLLLLFANVAVSSEADDYIKEGIKLHDKGLYDKAAEKYKMALKLEPNHSFALYELTFSYMLGKKNKECIKTAKKGLNLKSNLQNKFIVALGSCYSQLGKTKEAIKSFKAGIKIEPENASLHLNIAVTYLNTKQNKKAISHLKEAIKYSNGYASSYYFIAEIYRTTNYRVPAMYFYMQFVLLEPNTRRSQDAAKKIYTLLFQGVEKKENGDMTIFVKPDVPKDEGDFSSLEVALSLTAAASSPEKNKKSKTDIERYTEALTSFVQICSEIKDKKLDVTFTWQYAAKNMIVLQNNAVFNTYAYILAEKAGIKGATDWLNKNQVKIEKMSRVLKTLK